MAWHLGRVKKIKPVYLRICQAQNRTDYLCDLSYEFEQDLTRLKSLKENITGGIYYERQKKIELKTSGSKVQGLISTQ